MSQAFCVLTSQLLFLAGADARDDIVGVNIFIFKKRTTKCKSIKNAFDMEFDRNGHHQSHKILLSFYV